MYDYNNQKDGVYNLKFFFVLYIKVTRHSCFKNSKNLRPLDILACNSANKPSFQNLTKSLFAQCSIDVKSAMSLRGFEETKFWEGKWGGVKDYTVVFSPFSKRFLFLCAITPIYDISSTIYPTAATESEQICQNQ